MKNEKKKIVDNLFFTIALLIGAIAVFWIGFVFIRSNVLAFSVTIIIGSIYGIGVVELLRFRNATSSLSAMLSPVQENVTIIDEWLAYVDPSIRNAVRARIQGENVGLPAPVLTPYFVGLLVMLGLLGTFIGMVDTLKGTVIALEQTADLQAIREGLTAPIKGLGLAFGTSVAGVATSAMLGLMSTLSRRDRMFETRQLDTKIPVFFKEHSRRHLQEETFRALQIQTQALPAVAEKLDSIAGRIENLNDNLIHNQKEFYQSVKLNFSEFAVSLDAIHKHSIVENARMTYDTIKPFVQDILNGISKETKEINNIMISVTKENFTESLRLFTEASENISELWKNGVAAHNEANEGLVNHVKSQVDKLQISTDELIQSRIKTEKAWLDEHKSRMTMLMETIKKELGVLRDDEDRRGRAAIDRLADLESTLTTHLTALGKGFEEPLGQLIEKVSEVPHTVAEVVSQLRQEVSKSIQRDNSFVKDQQHVMETLNLLSASLNESFSRQNKAIDQLIASTRQMLEEIGQRFSQNVDSEISHISGIGEMFAVSAVEMAGLGDAFNKGVQLFSKSNDRLLENFSSIEAALEQSIARSDDQLAYYVAQAREIIDQCMMSQKEIFETLQRFSLENNRELEAC